MGRSPMGSEPVARGLATSDPSPALVLYLWLRVCEVAGIEPPKGTKAIVADDALCDYLANVDLAIDGYTMPFYLVLDAFGGLPVKQVKGLVSYVRKNIPEVVERDSYLRYRAGKKRGDAA